MKRRFTSALLLPVLLILMLVSGCKAASPGGNTAPAVASGAGVLATATASGGSTGSAACPTSNTTSFAKTKFVLHAGLAFGAFHRYIYKPFRNGTFQSGAHGRFTAFLKAGLAALFIKREVRLAYDDTKANPTLCKLIATPLQAVGDKISGVVGAIGGGDFSGLSSVEQAVQDAKIKAASAGTSILENANAPLH